MTGAPTGHDGVCLEGAALAGLTEFVWSLHVANAGPKGLRFLPPIAQYEDEPGCKPTVANPVGGRIRLVSGPTQYGPNGAGLTIFAANVTPRGDGQRCGHAQFDIDGDDGTSYVGLIVNFGVRCAPPAPVCPARDQILSGPASWIRNSGTVTASFALRPDLAGPVGLALGSYQVSPAAIRIGSWPALPQRLVASASALFSPGQVGSLTVLAASCEAQVDLLACHEPAQDLTVENFPYWGPQTVSFWPLDGIAELPACR